MLAPGWGGGGKAVAPLSYLLPAAAWMVFTFMLLEYLRWRRGVLMISRRRFRLRMAEGGALVVLLAAIFVGRFILVLLSPRAPLFWGWWLGCLGLGLLLMYLASVDMNEVDALRAASQQKLWTDFARSLREDEPQDKPPKQDS